MLVATVSQAGMFFWFAMTTMIAVPMYLFASFACLLILTSNNRGALANYVMLSAALGLLFVTPHPAYIFGFFLPVVAVFVFDNYPNWMRKPWRGYTPVFIAACATALVLAAYRLLPVFSALIGEGSVVGNMPWLAYSNDAYFGLTAFNPLALGIQIGEAMQIAGMIGYGSGIHTQFHNALYFGIAPLIIIYIALRTGAGTKGMLLAIAAIAAQLAYLYAFQPISDVVQMVFYPLIHGAIFRLSSNFAFLFLLIFGIRHLVTVDRTVFQKAIRECVIIAGFVLMAAAGMYGRVVLHKFQAGEIEAGMPVIINGFRFALLSIMVCMALIYRFDIPTFARYRFGLFGAIVGGAIVVFFDAVAWVTRILPGNEMTMAVFENTLAVILVCFAVVFLARSGTSKIWHRMALIFGIAATFLLLITLSPSRPANHPTFWATVIGWGVFIALVAIVSNIFGRWANRSIEINTAMGLLFVVTLADLVASFGNYSYVNIYSASPYYRSLADVYPRQKLPYPDRVAQYSADLDQERGQQNLLVNNELNQTSGQIDGWVLGGKNMGLCPTPAETSSGSRKGTAHLCYPASDGGGNLYQDVALMKPIRQVALGAWIKAEPGMSSALFLTSPSTSAAVSSIVKQEGDGKWHWLNTNMEASELLGDARAHVNLQKAGSAEVYAPRLVYGPVVQPDRRPSDGHEVVEPKNAQPRKIDLDLYRVNHVTLFNGAASNELMSNYAMVYGTPTYAGVDSDQSQDFVDFLKNFQNLDPSWFHRAGLTSVLENERLLNLFGVGYDFSATGTEVFRPDAISRIAAFSDFEVQSDRKQALQRIKSENFDTTKVVLLEKAPALPSSSNTKRFQRLTYDMHEADQVRVKVAADMPRLIVFNDRFSPNWEAHWNGNPLAIQRANTLFMAVTAPQGEGELTFDFHPRQFIMLSKVSSIMAGFLLLLGAAVLYGIIRTRYNGRTPN